MRDAAAAAQWAAELPHGKGSKLVIVTLDSRSQDPDASPDGPDPASSPSDDTSAAIATIQNPPHNICRIDVVIANAAVAHSFAPVASMRLVNLLDHVAVNVWAPVRLFQAALPLLRRSATPKFVVVSSVAGSLGFMDRLMAIHQGPVAAYGASKAMVNFLVRRIHFEEPELTAFVIDPGLVNPLPVIGFSHLWAAVEWCEGGLTCPGQLGADRHGQCRRGGV